MSNYLANLVARSFTPAEAIQPRLPSRFEPIADGASSDGIAVMDVIGIGRAGEGESAAAHRGSQAMRDARAGFPASPLHEPHREAEAVAQPLPPRELRVPPSDARIASERPTPAPEDHRGESADARDEQPASSPTDAPVQVTIARRDRAPASRHQSAGARPGSRQAAAPHPGAIQPDVEPEAEGAASQDRQPSAQASRQELIQVTIGRIEVRAVAPPAIPAKAAAAQTHTLSLADYLRGETRGRAGGGR